MSNEQGLEQKRQWLKFFEALAENEKFMEALLTVKPIPKLPNVSRADMVEITYVANEQAMLAMTDAIKADPQLWSDGTSIWGKLGEQIAGDIERMGAKLIELGFPDPRTDFSNWRIIALMVGADPEGMMDDIFEHAVAYHAKRERDAKQLEAPENKPVAPVKPTGRRGRKSKTESKLLKTNMLAHLRDVPSLANDPERLATLAGVSVSTARRLIDSERAKYAEMNRRK